MKLRLTTTDVRLAGVLLGAVAFVLAFVCTLFASIFEKLLWHAYGARSLAEARAIIPDITLLLCDHYWSIIPVYAVVLAVSIAALRRWPGKLVRVLAIGICAELLVAWLVMFCCFYNAFQGPMCLHHPSEFEPGEFLTCAYGVFPLTLIAMVSPLVMAFFRKPEMTSK